MTTAPTGTVTFLFTDIEGSTRLAQQFPAAWPAAQARHHALMRAAIEASGGHVFKVVGDAFCAAFYTAPGALAGALDAQRALHAEPWDGPIIRVRMGLHTGAAALRDDGDYEGYLTLARIQRIMSGACGGQVLLSQDAADLLRRDLPPDLTLLDLGTHRLKDLAAPERLFQINAPGLPSDFPPLKTAEHPNNLPAQLTSLIGRAGDVAEARRLLGGARLLTLLGAGGIGKTRLSLQIAVDELMAYPDGVWFIDLAALTDPSLVEHTIAAAVGAREEPGRPMLASLGEHFRSRAALIVLDNCEHLIEHAAQVCDSLLRAAPRARIIVTSREALGIAGEHVHRVAPLGVPGEHAAFDAVAQSPAAQLFVDRAQAARSNFALTAANAPSIAQICRRLDGIPLAIELAAARVRGMTAEQIAARLDDRFRVLTGGSRTALPRQQTLRATVDWSYQLLTEPEKVLLRRLSVFSGGWTLEAAEVVCSDEAVNSEQSTVNGGELFTAHRSLLTEDVLELLTRLVERSLVALDESGETPRYRMLETIRQFAREALDASGESEPLRDRQMRYFVDLIEQASDTPSDRGQVSRLTLIRAELDNLRAALTWAASANPPSGLRLVAAIGLFWPNAGLGHEGHRWARLFLDADTERTPSLARTTVLRHDGYWSASYLHDTADGLHELQECVDLCRTMGETKELAISLAFMWSPLVDTDPAHARAAIEEAIQLAESTGEQLLVAHIQNSAGMLWHTLGDYERARTAFDYGLNTFRAHHHDLDVSVAVANYGYTMLALGDAGAARDLFREGLVISARVGMPMPIVWQLYGLAAVAAAQQLTDVAATLFGVATALKERAGQPLDAFDQRNIDRHLALARAQDDPAAFEAAYAAGYALSMDEAIERALDISRAN